MILILIHKSQHVKLDVSYERTFLRMRWGSTSLVNVHPVQCEVTDDVLVTFHNCVM